MVACSPDSPRSRVAPSWWRRDMCMSTPRHSRPCRWTWARGPPEACHLRPPPRRPESARDVTPTGVRRRDAPPRHSC